MGVRVNVVRRRLAAVPPEFRPGFPGFFHRLTMFGLEAFGLYYGTYRAKVVSTDDPEHDGQPDPFGRIRINVPSVGDTAGVERLAWPVVPFAGDGYGLHSIPQVGNKVLVTFEGGSLDAPLWVGSWWVRDNIPTDLAGPDRHWWITPGGHKILMDDTDGSEVFRLEHSGGAKVEIDAQGGVVVESSSGQKVTLGAGSLEPGVKGDTLKGLLENLIDAIIGIQITTPAGPASGVITSAQFTVIRARLQQILSQVVELG